MAKQIPESTVCILQWRTYSCLPLSPASLEQHQRTHCTWHGLQEESPGRPSTASSFTFQIGLGRGKFSTACSASWAAAEDLLMSFSNAGGTKSWCFPGWLWCGAECASLQSWGNAICSVNKLIEEIRAAERPHGKTEAEQSSPTV